MRQSLAQTQIHRHLALPRSGKETSPPFKESCRLMARNDGGLVLGLELEDTGWGRARGWGGPVGHRELGSSTQQS